MRDVLCCCSEMDGLTSQLEARASEVGAELQCVNQQNLGPIENNRSIPTPMLVLQLKDAKRQYREHIQTFKEKKTEVAYLNNIKEQMVQRVTQEFSQWKQQAQSQSPQCSEPSQPES